MNILIENALAVLPNGGKDEIGRHNIYIEEKIIAGIDEEPQGFKADKVISGDNRLVIPGLINSHTHTYMSMMRNCADDLSFTDWLFNTIDPIEAELTPEDAYWGSLLGQIEMIKAGTTTFNDQQMHIHMVTRAAKESGMRAVISRGLVGSEYDRSDRRLTEALEEMGDGKDCDRLNFLLGPHAPYSCGPEYLRMIADVAAEKGLGIHMHIAEGAVESENMERDHHCTPVEYVRDAGIFKNHTIAAHCIRVSDSDMDILKENNVSVVTNPASNMKLGNGFAPVPAMLDKGINVCLGTDGAASNNGQNMFREMGFLSLIHKGVHDTPQCVGAKEVFKMSTINGAKALGLDKITGSIEKGKRADLAILRLDVPSMMPNNNLLAALCYSANGSEVDTVVIDGQVVMEDREIKTLDEERVYHEIRSLCERLGLDKKSY
ncbi:MAG: amidohydrolase [Lachnospiraceae bacterium]|nr:amidohydrolase [Lachnospiraceae bacterium]